MMNSFIKRNHIARSLKTIVIDFINDFTDQRWKFLNLKHFTSQETNAHLFEIE